MTFEEAQQLIAVGESVTQEFKRTTGQRTESAHTLVAMLHNREGNPANEPALNPPLRQYAATVDRSCQMRWP